MKPYGRGINYNNKQKVFNYRLSRARRVIECAFGTLTKRWRIYESPLDWKLESTEVIILATICMHNYLITDELNEEELRRRYTQNDDRDFNNDEDDQDEHFEGDINDVNLNNALQMRNILADYFISPNGQIPWQWEKAFVI